MISHEKKNTTLTRILQNITLLIVTRGALQTRHLHKRLTNIQSTNIYEAYHIGPSSHIKATAMDQPLKFLRASKGEETRHQQQFPAMRQRIAAASPVRTIILKMR